MRTILRIMRTELRVLFFSPIAWLILIVFAFQVGLEYSDGFTGKFLSQELGYGVRSATSDLYSGYSGLMTLLLKHLYLYIPLFTMGMMSRELSSGSIKLLYSSPVSNFQIIIGKYLSALVYGLILCAMFIPPFIHTVMEVKDADIPLMLTALLGVYLTIAAYAAIGLFMSTITKYQVVAVVGTLAILAILNFIGGVGQEYDFVRDITYWLSISGRSREFIIGLICTKDVLYFVMVIFMFLSMSIVKLQGERLKLSIFNKISKYVIVVVTTLLVGYVSSRPQFIAYYDATATKSNTLTVESQEIVAQLKGDMTITTYVNAFSDDNYRGAPRNRIDDISKFDRYLRFKPEIKMEYVYYYGEAAESRTLDNYREKDPNITVQEVYESMCKEGYMKKGYITYEEVLKLDDISNEDGRFVRVISSENGKKTKLRIYKDNYIDPHEAQITTALKTMLVEPPYVGFITGHKERGCMDYSEKGYGSFAANNTFRYSLINSGFRVKEITLDAPIPEDMSSIVLADVRSEFTPEQQKNFDDYIDRGGNLFILGEPKRQHLMNPILSKLGLRLEDGVLVSPSKTNLDDLIAVQIKEGASEVTELFGRYGKAGYTITTPSACAVVVEDSTKGYKITEVLATTSKGSWIEKETTDFINEKSIVNPLIGEKEQSNSVMLYLTKDVNDKKQRIFVMGDADCFSTLELSSDRPGFASRNFTLITEVFKNFSYGEFPVEASRVPAPDNKYLTNQNSLLILKIILMGVIPVALLIFAAVLLIRRKRK